MQKDKPVENNNVRFKFRCPLCDEKCESKVNLSHHVRRNHHKDQVCQTQARDNENTEREEKTETKPNLEYPCFYYRQIIRSKDEMQKHNIECCEVGIVHQENTEYFHPCHVLQPFPALHNFYPPPFTLPTDAPCFTCSERFKHRNELRRHYTDSHPDLILFWCDVCLTNFGSERGLQSHMRNYHKDYT